ncbi:hypothetical protein MJO28_009536 [Puccinia striiformis f. sp. tritici]|uniref:FYVE-type domain-containing protein n=2 Tax=Puccinia striiformis TaxID=27350 RepID=A0A2S4UR13_9BASI|nr:hypothetical protein MJO28_009536 [Puccinia striiformis f. sp. tritici]KAI7950646.1 hypothetical protein MJO29_009320 [Puccinia striiformis f. sp. tritici]POV99661.1 hypothetical protein PSHT_13503 [Puccinia striiformis]
MTTGWLNSHRRNAQHELGTIELSMSSSRSGIHTPILRFSDKQPRFPLLQLYLPDLTRVDKHTPEARLDRSRASWPVEPLRKPLSTSSITPASSFTDTCLRIAHVLDGRLAKFSSAMASFSIRRACSDDTASSSSNHNSNLTPPSAGASVSIQLPHGATHLVALGAENVTLVPQSNPTSHPHFPPPGSSPLESTFATVPTDDIQTRSNRAALDRRISLPLLGIDLGRSGPSYGQTLKRMSVAVYGHTNNVFEPHDNNAMKDHSFRPQPYAPSPTTSHQAHFLNTNSRPTFSVSAHPEGLVIVSSDSYASSGSNDGAKLHEKNESENHALPSDHPASTTVQSVFAGRSKSMRSPRPPGLKTQRDLKARNVNLPFKINMKYPPRGTKAGEEDRAGNDYLHKHPGLQANGHDSTKMHRSANTSRSSLDFPSSPQDEVLSQKNCKKQRQIVRELIESERRYCELLNKIQSNYIVPIQASQQTNDYQKMILSKKTTVNIFSNFSAILGLSSQFLASLENLGQNHKLFDPPIVPLQPPSSTKAPDGSQERQTLQFPTMTNSALRRLNVGETLMEFLPFFKLYTTFTSNFSVSQSTLHLHSARHGPSPLFFNLLEDCRRRGIDNGLGLAHMLLGIIQRVPRYELLIKELLKFSAETDADYRHLLSAQTMVGCVARRLEIGMNEQAATKTILTIQRAMEGLAFPLVIPSRKLVKIGQLKKIGRKGDLQDRVFFLFNDCLVYCGILKNGNVESVQKWLGQLGATYKNAHSIASLPTGPVNVLTIKHISTSFLLPFTHGDDNSPRLIFCRKMNLHDVTTVGAVGGRKSEFSTGFQVISSAKSFVVYASNATEKEEWISTLRETKSELLDSRTTLFIKEDSNDREDTSQLNKLGFIVESPPPRGYSWLSLASSEEETNPANRDKAAERTPQKSKNGHATVSLPAVSNYKSPTHSSMFTNLLSPRARLYSTPSKSSIFNWKPSVNLSIPPLTNQTTQILEGIQVAHAGSLAEHTNPPIESTDSPEPKSSSQTRNQHDQPKPPRKHLGMKYVAENYCAPVWVPDNHVSRCMGKCQTWFSVLKRRHHCRLCGGVFCSACSSRLFVIKNQEQGDQLARACEACFQSVFLNVHDGKAKQTTEEDGLSRPLLSNRPHDDQDLPLRRHRPHLRHAHRQSLPMDMGSEYFRHSSLANLGKDDHRRSIVSILTSVGGDSACGVSKVDELNESPNCDQSPLDENHENISYPAPCTSPAPSQTQARQRLTSLLQSRARA